MGGGAVAAENRRNGYGPPFGRTLRRVRLPDEMAGKPGLSTRQRLTRGVIMLAFPERRPKTATHRLEIVDLHERLPARIHEDQIAVER